MPQDHRETVTYIYIIQTSVFLTECQHQGRRTMKGNLSLAKQHLEQSINEWTKWNLWKTDFKMSEVIWPA